jgi:PAS domain S-box-containing protein
MSAASPDSPVAAETARGRILPIAAGVLLVVAGIAAMAALLVYGGRERERDLALVYARLNVVADSRHAALQTWIDRNQGELRGLAENQSVQLYLTELGQAQGNRAAVTDEPAQLGYLRNLLIVSAERAGFGAGRSSVAANVRRTASGGLALLDAEAKVLVASPDMPPVDEALAQRIAGAPKDKPSVIDVFIGPSGQPLLGFLAPVYAIQADPGTSQRIGYALGLRELGEAFFGLLRQPGTTENSAEALLVRRQGGSVEYLMPAADSGVPVLRPVGDRDLAGGLSVVSRAGFEGRDHRGRDVLAVARDFTVVPWTLLYKVDRAEALAEGDARRRAITLALGLLIVAVAAGFVAVWWFASSRRATEAAVRYRDLAQRYGSQETLLRSVTDSQPDLIYLVDGEGRLRFANAAVARRSGVAVADMDGRMLADVLGPDYARRIGEVNRKARKQARAKTRLMRETLESGGERVLQTAHIPIAGGDGAVLVVERDVTGAVVEREKRARALRAVVDALVTLIDRRDPYCADHARRVGQVAAAIAGAMAVDMGERATIEIAASLMNLGKVLVPTELLTKTGKLSDVEMKQVRDSILHSADFVQGIEFEGPVIETLRQLQERIDGAGYPLGLKGDEILLTARILAAANAFVSMVSPRAWREAIPIDQAMESLRRERDKAFDRRVIAALDHCLENAGGAERWRAFAQAPTSVAS